MDSSRWVESVRSPAVIPSYEGSGLWQAWRILNYFLSFSSSPILMSPQLLPACYSIFLIHAAFLCFRSLHGVELLHLPLQFGSKQKGVTFRCLCSASQCKTWEHSDYSEELLEEACEAGWHNKGGTWTCTGVACPTYQAIQSVTLIFSRSFLHMCKLSAPSSSVLDNIPMGGCKGQVARVAFLHALFKVIQE